MKLNFPDFGKPNGIFIPPSVLNESGIRRRVFFQNVGDVVIVPEGVFHAVYSLPTGNCIKKRELMLKIRIGPNPVWAVGYNVLPREQFVTSMLNSFSCTNYPPPCEEILLTNPPSVFITAEQEKNFKEALLLYSNLWKSVFLEFKKTDQIMKCTKCSRILTIYMACKECGCQWDMICHSQNHSCSHSKDAYSVIPLERLHKTVKFLLETNLFADDG